MKKINFLLMALLIAGTASLTSCKKEAQIEKNLWNKGGEWEIKTLNVQQTSTDPSDSYTETLANYGTITFNKDGSGSYRFTVDGDVETGNFTYSNTEDNLTLIADNQTRVFDMDWKKNDLDLSITESYTSNGESITYRETLNLEKK